MRYPFRRPSLRASLAMLAATAAGLVALDAIVASARAAQPDQAAATIRYFPDLQSRGFATPTVPVTSTPMIPLAASAPAGADGIEGWGFSTIDYQNLSADVVSVETKLGLRQRGNVTLRRTLAGLAGTSLPIGDEPSMIEGFWSGRYEADDAVAGIARTTWPLSATVAYEAIAPARQWLMPLIIRGLDEHYSIYYVQNAYTDTVTVTYQWFDPDTGGIESEWADELAPGEVVNMDAIEFSTPLSNLPGNVRGGFIGGLRVLSTAPVAVMVYNNEAFDGGVSAYVARPRAEAATSHALPVVRSNYLGDSLIAVANGGDQSVDVTITYRGDPASPWGADASTSDRFTIGPRGAKMLDLSGRGWSTAGASQVSRGSGTNTGFVGSAMVTATGAVAVTVLETAVYPAAVRASASYNGFTPAELGSAFAVPALRHVPGGRTTRVVFQNPGDAAVSVETVLFDAGAEVRRETTVVPAGSARSFATSGDVTATLSARIVASSPIAALVYETPWDSPAEWGPSGDLGYDTAAYAAPRASGPDFPTPRPPTITPTPTPDPTGTPVALPPSPTPETAGRIYFPSAER